LFIKYSKYVELVVPVFVFGLALSLVLARYIDERILFSVRDGDGTIVEYLGYRLVQISGGMR